MSRQRELRGRRGGAGRLVVTCSQWPQARQHVICIAPAHYNEAATTTLNPEQEVVKTDVFFFRSRVWFSASAACGGEAVTIVCGPRSGTR